MKRLFDRLGRGETLSEAETAAALDALTRPDAEAMQRSAFLMALRVRGETVEEITGAARYLRANMVSAEAPEGAVDIVGTGGDGHGTYNVSTCAALVAAGAGLKIAKHGNRSVSSQSGASDVLQALGVKLAVAHEIVTKSINEAGIGFLFAPLHHPAMKVWAPARAALGIRTLFNLLGPLCNPAGVKRQVLGVYDRRWVQPLARVLRNLGSEHAWVVHGSDGLDELTTTGVSYVAELKTGAICTFEVVPDDAHLARATLADLKGGDCHANAAEIRAVLAGKPGPCRDIVLLNAAAALIVGGRAETLADGARLAAQAIETGAAKAALDRLVSITNAAAA